MTKATKWLVIIILHAWSIQVLAQKNNHVKNITFSFGGYIKADFINTWFADDSISGSSPIRDVHIPALVPLGVSPKYYNLDFHVKESRFNFDVSTDLGNEKINGFLELDFLLSNGGNERVSNSFQPRLRHFYFEWRNFLIGQSWTTFMIVIVPDDLDLSGGMDGLVFGRQPQIRYSTGDWQFSLENSRTTAINYLNSVRLETNKELHPDIVIRRNINKDWGTWSVAGLYRILIGYDIKGELDKTPGFGITTGGRVSIGKRGDDLRSTITFGKGLGRYVAANFITGGVFDLNNNLIAIGSLNGYIAWNHYWVPKKWSSSFNIAAFQAFNYENWNTLVLNNNCYSASANLKWTPEEQLLFGVEFMHVYREELSGLYGSFNRIQFSAKYKFGYLNKEVLEK